MNHKNLAILFILVFLINLSNSTTFWAQQEAEGPPTVKITFHPASEPIPALKYSLLPEFLDQTSGNALSLYYQAAGVTPKYEGEEFYKKTFAWLELPVEALPIKEVQLFLQEFTTALHQVELAAHRERCDWELPIRSEGIKMILPNLGKFRDLSKVLALQAKLQIAQGRYDEAVRTLQMGFAMAGHIAEAGFLVNDLVGIFIAALMLQEVEHFVQAPGAPNLYWALSGLGAPLIDIRYAVGVEGDLLYIEFPELRHIEQTQLTSKEMVNIYSQLDKLLNLSDEVIGWVEMKPEQIKESIIYSEAKRHLIEEGRPREEVETLSPAYVILMYQTQEYKQMRDEIIKWFNVPFPQAWAPLKKADQSLSKHLKATKKDQKYNPFMAFFPFLSRAYYSTTKLDRQIAALRCVEAIRMYAADNDGKLPAALGDITMVPIPFDPVTGKDFIYQLNADTAVLEAPLFEGDDPSEGLRYELTIKN